MDDISVGLGTAKAQSETAETCATCGRPLTQRGPNGECLRCLVSLTFLGDEEQPERPAARSRLTPGPLRYAHFEVETAADGFPVELGAGAMAITYRARDTVLNSLVALGHRSQGRAESWRAVPFSARSACGGEHSSPKCGSGDILRRTRWRV